MTATRSNASTANPLLDQADKNPYLPPPSEEFWRRYSPHHEAPISATTSLFLHIAVVLLMIGVVWLGWKLSDRRNLDMPLVVQLPGGGGGNPLGDGPAPGLGSGHEDVDKNSQARDIQPLPGPLPDLPQVKDAGPRFDSEPGALRPIHSADETVAAIRRLNKAIFDKSPDGVVPGKGKDGPGSDGGKDKGKGPAEGSQVGNGPRDGKLDPRVQRMLRWVMVFETQSPSDYVKQLHGLGAIVAIPNNRDDYDVVEDLTARPAKLVAKDVAKFDCIYWADKNPTSVRGVLNELRINQTASHFVAFMPHELETKLADMELKHQGLREEQIDETTFKVYRSGTRYDMKVVAQSKKKQQP